MPPCFWRSAAASGGAGRRTASAPRGLGEGEGLVCVLRYAEPLVLLVPEGPIVLVDLPEVRALARQVLVEPVRLAPGRLQDVARPGAELRAAGDQPAQRRRVQRVEPG